MESHGENWTKTTNKSPVFQVPTFSFDSFQQILIIRDDKLLANNNASAVYATDLEFRIPGCSSSTGNKHKYLFHCWAVDYVAFMK
jgi:hypothetical protein